MDKRAQLKEQLSMLFDVTVENLSDELTLNKDLYASSLHFFGILSGIEELTGKSLDYETVKACRTIGKVLALLD